jgi:hypothetical protein
MEFNDGSIWLTPPEASHIEQLMMTSVHTDIWSALRSATINWVDTITPEDSYTSTLPYEVRYLSRLMVARTTWRPEQGAPIQVDLTPRQLLIIKAFAGVAVIKNIEGLKVLDPGNAIDEAIPSGFAGIDAVMGVTELSDEEKEIMKADYPEVLRAEIEVYTDIIDGITGYLDQRRKQ